MTESEGSPSAERVTPSSLLEGCRTRWPDRVAVEQSDGSTATFAEMATRVDAVASTLAAVMPMGAVVGLWSGRGIAPLADLLGIFRAGCIAVALDPNESTTAHEALLGRFDGHHFLDSSATINSSVLQRLVVPDDGRPDERLLAERDPAAGGTYFSTSGSTGQPKVVYHKTTAMGRTWEWMAEFVADSSVDGITVPLFLPLAFGPSWSEVYMAWAYGGRVIFVDPWLDGVVAALEAIDRPLSRRIKIGPEVLGQVVAEASRRGVRIPQVVQITAIGGALSDHHLVGFGDVFPNCSIRVEYGSTETGLIADRNVTPAELAAGLRMPPALHIADQAHVRIEPLPDLGDADPNMPQLGEILGTSRTSVRRYVDDEELSDSRFVVDEDGTWWARSGDMGWLDADGMLHVEGRLDDRVKVNGAAVDMNRVRTALLGCDRIRDAAVTVVQRSMRSHLVAWVVTERGVQPTVRELREQLSAVLPRTHLPHVIRAVAVIPMTSRGKVDRTRLTEMASEEVPLGVEVTPPRSDVEVALVTRFRSILQRHDVGVDEGFFELGGDSLASVELLTWLYDEFLVPIDQRPLLEATLFELGSARRLAEVLENTSHTGGVDDAGVGVVRLQSGRREPTVYLVPGGGAGQFIELRHFVRGLAPHAVVSLAPPGHFTTVAPSRTVEAAGSALARAVRRERTDEPGAVAVVGYSVGGLMALEASRSLRAAGASVVTVLLDSPVSSGLGMKSAPRALGFSVAAEWLRVRHWLANRRGRTPDRSELHRFCASVMSRRYRPRPVDWPVVLIRATDGADTVRPDLGWGRVCSQLEVHEVAGTHSSMVLPPVVSEVARIVRDAVSGSPAR